MNKQQIAAELRKLAAAVENLPTGQGGGNNNGDENGGGNNGGHKADIALWPWIPATWQKFGFSDNPAFYDVHETNPPLAPGRAITLTVITAPAGKTPGQANQLTGIPVIFEIDGTRHKRVTGRDGGGNTAQQAFTVRPGTTEIPVWVEGEKEATLFTYRIRGEQGSGTGTGTGGAEDENGGSDNTDDGKPIQYPEGNGTQVLVMFMEEALAPQYTGAASPPRPVDVTLNGTTYPLSRETSWNSLLDGSKSKGYGRIFTLPGPLTSFSFRADQAKKPGLNLFGFGWWKFKIINLAPGFDMSKPVTSPGAASFWGTAASTGALVGPAGWNTHTGTFFPDFHKRIGGANFNGLLSVPELNKTGKIGIYLYGYGVNNPNFDANNNFTPVG